MSFTKSWQKKKFGGSGSLAQDPKAPKVDPKQDKPLINR